MARTLKIGLVLLLLFAVVAAPVDARRRRRKVPTNLVTGTYTTDAFGQEVLSISGGLASKKLECLFGRNIVVESSPGVLFGTATSDTNGDWLVEGQAPTDQTYGITVTKSGKCAGDTDALFLASF